MNARCMANFDHRVSTPRKRHDRRVTCLSRIVLLAVVLAAGADQPGNNPAIASNRRQTTIDVAPVLLACSSVGTSRPGNGKVLRRGGPYGRGEFQIKNAPSSDAVVALSTAGTVVRAVYVRSGETATVSNIPDGTYDIYYTSGSDWDADAFAFCADPTYQEFDTGATFTTIGNRYTIYILTLYGVVGGNMTSHSISPEQFPK